MASHVPLRRPILLVSSSPDERDMYGECLGRHGYSVIQAHTAAEALRVASEIDLAAVVTGRRLAGADDGLALTRRLKSGHLTRRVPVVMLTGYVFHADRDAAAAAGCDRFVSKPCLPDALAREIRRCWHARLKQPMALSHLPHAAAGWRAQPALRQQKQAERPAR